MGRIVGLCLQIIPIILFLGSIFAYFYVVNVGPRELPRKHPLNRKMALPVFVVAIGMFMIPLPDLLGYVGIGLSVVGIFWYANLFGEARKEFPPMTDKQWLDKARARYSKDDVLEVQLPAPDEPPSEESQQKE
jgi:hypothetical protein